MPLASLLTRTPLLRGRSERLQRGGKKLFRGRGCEARPIPPGWTNYTGVAPPSKVSDVACCSSRELSYSQPHNRRQQNAARPAGTLAEVFHAFWRARGVHNPELLSQLVSTGLDGIGHGSATSSSGLDGSSLGAWAAESVEGSAKVVAISQRLSDLLELLGIGEGHEDVDVVWMAIREPRLLTAKLTDLRAMLLHMKVADGCEGLDVVKICEAQPSLLLQDPESISDQETFAGRILAWKHGLVSDSDEEWARRFAALEEYTRSNGDAHVGCRDGDDPDMKRWAKRQRASHRAGDLSEDRYTQCPLAFWRIEPSFWGVVPDPKYGAMCCTGSRQNALESLNFAFTDDDAEWNRWYNELSTFHIINGHSNPAPLAAVTDLYLINWCGVQRIARRNGVMPSERIGLLDALDFDWTGADPLS